jgi:hypothetical protein
MAIELSAYNSHEELFQEFQKSASFSKHLLIIYSLAIGLNAKKIIDLGIGSTTRVLRMAVKETKGIVWSCDCDAQRYSTLLASQDAQWKLFLQPSEIFLKNIQPPIDFVVHDAAHDYFQVKLDLELILPKMKRFGIICVHDSQQPYLGHDILSAIRDATHNWKVSITTIPFNAGLSIIRLEEGGSQDIIPVSNRLDDGRVDTELFSFSVTGLKDESGLHNFDRCDNSIKRWIRWRMRKLIKKY